MLSIIFLYSPAWLFLILPLAALFSFWAYRGKGVYSPRQALLLALLRFLLLSGLGFLLLQPQWQHEELRREKPFLLWLEDRSASMTAQPDSAALVQFWQVEAAALRERLSEKYRLRHFLFSEDLQLPGDSFSPGVTDIAKALHQSQGRFFRQPVAGAVLISDGLHNRGQAPSLPARQSAFPVHSLFWGDSLQKQDAAILRLEHNPSVLRGRRFPLLVALEAFGLGGQSAILRLKSGQGRLLEERKIEIQGREFFRNERFSLRADSVGLRSYRVEWEVLAEDAVPANNQQRFSLEVIDQQQRLAFLSRSSHPDLGALMAAAKKEAAYALELAADGSVPDTAADLYLLYEASPAQVEAVLRSRRPFVVLGSAAYDWSLWAEAWPGAAQLSGEAEASFARVNPDFVRFQTFEPEALRQWPPVNGHYGPLKEVDGPEVILYKTVAGVRSEIPLCFVRDENFRRGAYFLGEGLWRWRLHNYRKEGNFETFDGFWLRLFSYLLASNSERERLRVQVESRYAASAPIDFQAQLLDPSGALSQRGDLVLSLEGPAAEAYEYRLSPYGQGYRTQIKGLEPGLYRYRLEASLGEERFVRRGEWLVSREELERQDLRARPQVLAEISGLSGGMYQSWGEREKLWQYLAEAEVPQQSYRSTNKQPFLSFWPIYFVFLTLAAGEWFLRKFWGNL